jgi:hypothetical protein
MPFSCTPFSLLLSVRKRTISGTTREMEKTIISPKLDDLAEGDIHLANLSAYAKHLVSVEDPDRAAHNAGLLYLTVIVAFQQAGITNVQWSPNLILEIGSREYEVSASRFVALGGEKRKMLSLLEADLTGCHVVDHRSISMIRKR